MPDPNPKAIALNLEGLLLTKQGQRPKDQMDAALLSQALAELRNRKK